MRTTPLVFSATLLLACAAAPADPPLGGLTCGTSPAPAADGPPPAYTTGATGVAWLSSSAIAPTRSVRRLWHTHAGYGPWPDPRNRADPVAYPAPTVDPDNCLSTETVAVIYDYPGTCAASVDVTPWDEPTNKPTGPTVTYAQQVVRPPDTRPAFVFAADGDDANPGTPDHPLKSAARLAKLAARGHCRLLIAAPYVMDCGAAFSPGSGTTIEGRPAADGTLPVLHVTGPFCLVGVGGKVSDVLVRRVRFTADGVANGRTLVGPSAAHGARAQAGQSWGSGVLFDQCEFGCLVQLCQQWAGDGFAVTRSVQLQAETVAGQGFSSWGGTRPLFAFDVLPGCYAESPLRLDGNGVGKGLGIEWCFLGQLDPTASGGSDKPVPDVRSADRAVIAHNAVVNAPLTFSGGHGLNSCRDVLVSGNVYRSADGVHPQQFVVVKEAVIGLSVTGEDFGSSGKGAVAVSVAADPAQADLCVPTAASTYGGGLRQLEVGGSSTAVSTGAK